MRGVVDSEKKVNHRFVGGQISILLEDSRAVCEGVSDWSIEFGDDGFQKGPSGICYWKELVFAERRG